MGIVLDYDAQVSNLIDPRAPFSVNVTSDSKGALPPGDRKYKDYIPKNVVPVKASDSVRKKNFMRTPTSRNDGPDYISPEDSAVRRRNDKARILELAKEIYRGDEQRRIVHRDALKTLENPKLDEKDATVIRARKIIARGIPLTKEQAVEKATQQFYGIRS